MDEDKVTRPTNSTSFKSAAGQSKPDHSIKRKIRQLHADHVDELKLVWTADKRMPTLESRKAWADARGADHRAVNKWFHRQRSRFRVRGDASLLEGDYELHFRRDMHKEDADVNREENISFPNVGRTKLVKTKHETTASPHVRIKSNNKTCISPEVRIYTVADSPAYTSQDSPPSTSMADAKALRPRSAIRHTDAHDLAPDLSCVRCYQKFLAYISAGFSASPESDSQRSYSPSTNLSSHNSNSRCGSAAPLAPNSAYSSLDSATVTQTAALPSSADAETFTFWTGFLETED